jgi:MarR family transcriptional regulator, organic hydroperoxide resistance regulator
MTDDRAPTLDDLLCFSIYATAHMFNRAYKPLLDAIGLTYPQYLVMRVLWERDDRTVKELGELLGLDSGTLTPLLKRLEAAGLVERRRDRQDERLVRILLTAAGQALAERAGAVHTGIHCAVDGSGENLASLKAGLDRLRATIERNLDR